jgi:hypothetical protein
MADLLPGPEAFANLVGEALGALTAKREELRWLSSELSQMEPFGLYFDEFMLAVHYQSLVRIWLSKLAVGGLRGLGRYTYCHRRRGQPDSSGDCGNGLSPLEKEQLVVPTELPAEH